MNIQVEQIENKKRKSLQALLTIRGIDSAIWSQWTETHNIPIDMFYMDML